MPLMYIKKKLTGPKITKRIYAQGNTLYYYNTDLHVLTKIEGPSPNPAVVDAAYGGGRLLVIYNGGTAIGLPNGTGSFTFLSNIPSQLGSTAQTIAYGNGTFVLFNNIGKYCTSTDGGLTWSAATLIPGYDTNVTVVRFFNGYFLVGGYYGLGLSTGTIVYSSDLVNWTVSGSTGMLYSYVNDINYDNGTYWIAGAGRISYSTNLSTWTVMSNNGHTFIAILGNLGYSSANTNQLIEFNLTTKTLSRTITMGYNNATAKGAASDGANLISFTGVSGYLYPSTTATFTDLLNISRAYPLDITL